MKDYEFEETRVHSYIFINLIKIYQSIYTLLVLEQVVRKHLLKHWETTLLHILVKGSLFRESYSFILANKFSALVSDNTNCNISKF